MSERGGHSHAPDVSQGYVMTSFSAQGAGADRVIVHLDTDTPGVSRLLAQQLIYVAVSRGRPDVQVFANSREELVRALLRSEEKATALEPGEISRYQRGNEVRNRVSVGMGI